ncbi:MAG: hypothetical protein D6731_23680, partial [Planctomycetota bacterium]
APSEGAFAALEGTAAPVRGLWLDRGRLHVLSADGLRSYDLRAPERAARSEPLPDGLHGAERARHLRAGEWRAWLCYAPKGGWSLRSRSPHAGAVLATIPLSGHLAAAAASPIALALILTPEDPADAHLLLFDASRGSLERYVQHPQPHASALAFLDPWTLVVGESQNESLDTRNAASVKKGALRLWRRTPAGWRERAVEPLPARGVQALASDPWDRTRFLLGDNLGGVELWRLTAEGRFRAAEALVGPEVQAPSTREPRLFLRPLAFPSLSLRWVGYVHGGHSLAGLALDPGRRQLLFRLWTRGRPEAPRAGWEARLDHPSASRSGLSVAEGMGLAVAVDGRVSLLRKRPSPPAPRPLRAKRLCDLPGASPRAKEGAKDLRAHPLPLAWIDGRAWRWSEDERSFVPLAAGAGERAEEAERPSPLGPVPEEALPASLRFARRWGPWLVLLGSKRAGVWAPPTAGPSDAERANQALSAKPLLEARDLAVCADFLAVAESGRSANEGVRLHRRDAKGTLGAAGQLKLSAARAVVFAPDGRRLYAGGGTRAERPTGQLTGWERRGEGWSLLARRELPAAVRGLALDRSGERLLVGTGEGAWLGPADDLARLRPLPDPAGPRKVHAVSFVQGDGLALALCGGPRPSRSQVLCWSVRAPQRPPRALELEGRPLRRVRIVPDPDREQALLATEDGVWLLTAAP